MNDVKGCAVARSPRVGPTTEPPDEAIDPRRTVVVDTGPTRWDLLTVLRLHVARPQLAVELVRGPTDAGAIAAAFRAGAHAYVVGSGDPDTDRPFVQDACDAEPFSPSRYQRSRGA